MLPLILFFFTYTSTTELYTLSLHDALPISVRAPAAVGHARAGRRLDPARVRAGARLPRGLRHRLPAAGFGAGERSEEHTSELQSQFHLVCRLLLEKKNNTQT